MEQQPLAAVKLVRREGFSGQRLKKCWLLPRALLRSGYFKNCHMMCGKFKTRRYSPGKKVCYEKKFPALHLHNLVYRALQE
jgi:hypothetical protein